MLSRALQGQLPLAGPSMAYYPPSELVPVSLSWPLPPREACATHASDLTAAVTSLGQVVFSSLPCCKIWKLHDKGNC